MFEKMPVWLVEALSGLPRTEIVTPVMVVPRRVPPRGGEPIHYAVSGEDGKGETIYLRSHGHDFNIVPAEWLRSGVRTVVSLGPGLDLEGHERLVLLVQCFTSDPRLLEEFAERSLADVAAVEIDHRPLYGGPCSRLSAVL